MSFFPLRFVSFISLVLVAIVFDAVVVATTLQLTHMGECKHPLSSFSSRLP